MTLGTKVIQHSSASNEWGTPQEVIEAARTVLGAIDLDPASSPHFNERVKATAYYTCSGQTRSWWGNVFCNPPGGRTQDGGSLAAEFWAHAVAHSIYFDQAIFVGFTLELLRTGQSYGDVYSPLRFPFCVPRSRLRFVRPDGGEGSSPAHANVILYVPGSVNRTDLFVDTFQRLGDVCVPTEREVVR